ncbi:MAG: hypothetical protein ACI8X5_002069 [Planctomycetota bacterium]|jgi:hypothetical protein
MKNSLLVGLLVSCGICAAFVFPQNNSGAPSDQLLTELLSEQKKTNTLLQTMLGSPNADARSRKSESNYPSLQTQHLEQIAKGMEDLPKVLHEQLSFESFTGGARTSYLETMKTLLEQISKDVKYR